MKINNLCSSSLSSPALVGESCAQLAGQAGLGCVWVDGSAEKSQYLSPDDFRETPFQRLPTGDGEESK